MTLETRGITRKSGRMRAAPNQMRKHLPGPNHPNQASDWRATVNGTRIEKSYPMDSVTLERFTGKYVVTHGGCWEWQAYRNHKGYGYFSHGKLVAAHRASYKHFSGAIPTGWDVDHLCRNRACVNPDHLEAVTHRENLRRSLGLPGVNGRKTRCKYGHEFTPENTRMAAGNARVCRTCSRERKASRDALKITRTCEVCGKAILENNFQHHRKTQYRSEVGK